MMNKICVLLCTLLGTSFATTSHKPKIWPASSEYETYSTQTDTLQTIQLSQFDIVYQDQPCVDLLQAAVTRWQAQLQRLVPGRRKPTVNPYNQTLQSLPGLYLMARSSMDCVLRQDTDESYELVLLGKQAEYGTLTARTVFGLLRGLQSLSQLIHFGWFDHGGCCDDSAVFVIPNTPIQIRDKPVYSYRGILMDTARHFLPLPLIFQQLNAMEFNKMNVLHWHLTDSQSWPWVVDQYPELSREGAFCDDCVYTKQQIQQVIHQAALRGIRVIVEVDLPGHSQAIGASHPEFMTDCGTKGPSEPLNATSKAVYDFVHQIYQEIFDTWPDELVHVGGDEVPLECWKESPQIQAWMQQHGMDSEVDLLAYFESKLLDIVSTENKRAIVWQELFDWQLDLPRQTIIDVWKMPFNKTFQDATQQGYNVILSACWYLDHLSDSWYTYYQCDPSHFKGTDQQKQLVLGGHASMWGESVDATNFMETVWPRASAAAERLWTGPAVTDSDNEIADRLHQFRCRMVQLGIPASPIMPRYCSNDWMTTSTTASKEGSDEVVIVEE